MQFQELTTALNDALDRFDKMKYRELLLSANLSLLIEDERTIIEKWITREKAMIEIEKQELSKVLNEQTIIYERAKEDDPDFYYPSQREQAHTPGVDSYLIASNSIQQLRMLSYEEFTSKFFGK